MLIDLKKQSFNSQKNGKIVNVNKDKCYWPTKYIQHNSKTWQMAHLVKIIGEVFFLEVEIGAKIENYFIFRYNYISIFFYQN